MAAGMSDRAYQSDVRPDMKGLFNSIAYGLNSSVRRAIYERLDLLPESFRRFPKGLNLRDQQQESELVSLKTEEPQ
ncbi:UNVERIFIED_CONTAM: G-protein coupled receptor 1 [Sesamum angustifolium]|uniref:G-protein coupled receptor 1 n=1 Tax=Sesamum angustifolium TaxID=2727405 RepID=A0AAW2MAF6_9LAMI